MLRTQNRLDNWILWLSLIIAASAGMALGLSGIGFLVFGISVGFLLYCLALRLLIRIGSPKLDRDENGLISLHLNSDTPQHKRHH